MRGNWVKKEIDIPEGLFTKGYTYTVEFPNGDGAFIEALITPEVDIVNYEYYDGAQVALHYGDCSSVVNAMKVCEVFADRYNAFDPNCWGS